MSPRIPKLNDQLPAVIVSWRYSEISLMSVWPWKLKSAPAGFVHPLTAEGVRVKSKHSRFDPKAATFPDPSFAKFPTVLLHWVGSVRLGSPTGLPFALIHGEFTAGSVSPRLKFSVRKVCCNTPPSLILCAPFTYETSD